MLTPIAAVGCAVVMIGAAITHTRMKDYKGLGEWITCWTSRSSRSPP